MSVKARPRRRYESSSRREQARRTRARILAAAQRVFLERGYAGATIPRIAAEAGVAVETIYRTAPGKPGLLAAAVETALAGGMDNADLPVEQRPGIRRVIEEKDPVRKLQLYAATQPAEQRALRAELSPQQAADVLVTVCSRANYDSLVTERGWSRKDYLNWVADTLVRTLLVP